MGGRSVIVLGAGVSGLTTAVSLVDAGNTVQIFAAERPLDTTSTMAAAVWYPSGEEPAASTESWSRTSLAVFLELASANGTGVHPLRIRQYHTGPQHGEPAWSSWVPGFRRLDPSEIPAGYDHGFEFDVVRIEPLVYLTYLQERLKASRVEIEQVPLVTNLIDYLSAETVLVNCTGLGAGTLLGDDDVFPIRGQTVAVTNHGIDMGHIAEEHPVAISYAFPRNHEVILGGTREPGDWRTEPDAETTTRILADAKALDPAIGKEQTIDVRVGLRPGRSAVRVEAERLDAGWVVHNYGHGGSGYVLSWGCAATVAGIVAGLRV